ncbi:hypothetical protein AN963_29720 [Brevibacillus choshinensis]|uniref:histidine kinase n=1 Tax=Brevibacillus choshinensis TaxID=54911 RepID=A0ABR5MZS2_BRECH|nr:ATP-binding protein [Brevibacillus choshinensis]KQL43615.1 hypothetical protein AN963_29720 [Brevibacillus choshinensis]
MSDITNKIVKWKTFVIVSLFLLVLTGSRILWFTMFQSTEQPYAVNGQLDLRNWNAAEGHTIELDGQWEFYPHVWLMDPEYSQQTDKRSHLLIQVPGDWNSILQPGEDTPYGYGSYRLRILVNPEHDLTYSIRIPSVRSSSALYINGRLLAKAGEPGKNKKEYVAGNLPYTSSFVANGSSEIEVVIQAANYDYPGKSGIVRSIKFGTEEAIARQTQLSMAMQLLVAGVSLLHAVYALTLFFMGKRDRRLLYFSLMLASATLMYILATDEKLIPYWFPIDYETGVKLVSYAIIALSCSLLLCVKQQWPAFWKKAFPVYGIVCGAYALLELFLPAKHLMMLLPLDLLIMGTSLLITIGSLLRTSAIKDIKGNTLLLLALVAFADNIVWWGLTDAMEIKVLYYPFDLIIALACFVSLWFRRYFQVHHATIDLAAKLKRADQRKDQFLANTSHELRNPLHSILNLSQAVLEREKKSLHEQSVRDLELVLTVGRRMSFMLHDLLDVMSLKEGAPRLQLRSLSIQTIATGVFDMLQFMTEGKSVRLVDRIPEHFPPVIADENRVIQIVFNLLHNALKYTNEGEVSIQGYVKDGRAHIVISDTGIGMDKETMRRIFEPYEQGDSESAMVEGGFGLGLSISKQLMELHGGSLQAKSVPGQGSEFVFTLPLADQTASQEERQTNNLPSIVFAESTAAAASDPLDSISVQQKTMNANRPRILVVDDDPVNLKVMETILSVEEYDVTSVTNGNQALAVMDSQEWDLVISDVMMPHMSGYELTRTIRERFSITELPILLLTARSQPEDIENGFRVGANDYVTKPVDSWEVRSRVKALTEVKQSVRERLRMEAAWLQAQIQPHFLFNTLNAIMALSEINLDRMRNLLGVFSDFLRYKYKLKNMDELVPVEDELSIVRSYLFIEKERFDERLQVLWEIDDCQELKIPLFTIQPLVENSVRHGIMKRSRGGKIVIRIVNHETYAEISVEDDGVGMEESELQRILEKRMDDESGVGLLNTDLRLKRHYGKGLHIKSKPEVGTSVSFVVWKHHKE